jgi:hypothetical protein
MTALDDLVEMMFPTINEIGETGQAANLFAGVRP